MRQVVSLAAIAFCATSVVAQGIDPIGDLRCGLVVFDDDGPMYEETGFFASTVIDSYIIGAQLQLTEDESFELWQRFREALKDGCRENPNMTAWVLFPDALRQLRE